MRTDNLINVQKLWLATVATLLVLLWLSSCQVRTPQNNSAEGEDKLKVVSTSTIIADLTQTIGGDEITHTGILKPGADPHIYEPVPTDSVAFEQADLIFYNGYNLEPGLIRLMNATDVKAKKLAIGEIITPLDFEYQGRIQPDPHVWGDVENAIKMVNAIRDHLIELSPEDTDEFTENAAQLTAQLQQLDLWINQQIQTIPQPQRKLVTTHDAFQYYANAYGLEIIGTLIGISTEEQPSAKTVKNLADRIKASKVPTIFAETTINPQLIETVAQEARVELAPQKLHSDSIGASGSEADTYIKMLVSNTRTIVESLGGDYNAFGASNSNVTN